MPSAWNACRAGTFRGRSERPLGQNSRTMGTEVEADGAGAEAGCWAAAFAAGIHHPLSWLIPSGVVSKRTS